MTDPFVQVRDLHFSYSEEGPEVLCGISLTIHRGEYIALIGQNGSGKTTFAKVICGLLTPSRGDVLVANNPIGDFSITERAMQVGYCYQNPDHQIFLDSIEREVSFGPRNLGLADDVLDLRVEEALQSVGLWEYRNEEPYFAGKGERQKVAVASVLAMRPKLIVLDEPTTGLDWKGSQEMMALVRRIWQSGHTIIIITHNMRLVAEHAERAIVFSDGQILMDGSPEEIFSQPKELAKTFLKPPQITQLWEKVSFAGPPWLNVKQAKDYFLNLKGTEKRKRNIQNRRN